MPEQSIPLQSDTIGVLPTPVRIVTASVTPAPAPQSNVVGQQVVTVALPDGTIVDKFVAVEQFNSLLAVLRDIKRILLQGQNQTSLDGELDTYKEI